MRTPRFYINTLILISFCASLNGQGDIDPPVAPLFTMVSVQPETGKTTLNWNPSPSPDVAKYVVYNYKNGEGFAIDTIRSPYTVTYIYPGSLSSYISESYVIAAIDSSGNISPLSNELRTIYSTPLIDTCNKKITITWNKYKDFPRVTTGYKIFFSLNGGTFTEAGLTDPATNTLTIDNFSANATYCFEVVALLEGNYSSFSNKTCLQTGVQRAPEWINADFASTDDKNNIILSFTIDPQSQINTYRLERMAEGETIFSLISQIESASRLIAYTDKTAEPSKKYYYRLLAVNNCGNPVVSSNLAGNIIAKLEKDGNTFNLRWNRYRFWLGSVSEYKIYINEGTGFRSLTTVSPLDSIYIFNYESFMYDISGKNICFYVSASETGDPHGIAGETVSSVTCTETIENITVPNAFTPNNDLRNDLFRPVLSFTPAEYHLVITDRKNSILFESKEYMTEWDGKKNGMPMPEGVYLWYLRLKTPSGKQVTKTGTVTIIR
jgi:gliding motility-associated-like protein